MWVINMKHYWAEKWKIPYSYLEKSFVFHLQSKMKNVLSLLRAFFGKYLEM